ncbi:MAG: hypothetical protein H7A51_04385 [Akkermansiaceae bacterium]|nr:hypothetical protein [Akkermansiaceae bacterium]
MKFIALQSMQLNYVRVSLGYREWPDGTFREMYDYMNMKLKPGENFILPRSIGCGTIRGKLSRPSNCSHAALEWKSDHEFTFDPDSLENESFPFELEGLFRLEISK